MGFKTDLQSNNTDLQTILDAINELPEAGEGGTDTSGDTVTPETLVTGYTAHDASGEPITGVNPYELTSTNATVDEQADLIAQIQTALEGKAAGGGGSVETCTVTMKHYPSYSTAYAISKVYYQMLNDNGEIEVKYISSADGTLSYSSDEFILTNVIVNSLCYIVHGGRVNTITNGSLIFNFSTNAVIEINGNAFIEVIPTG